MLYRDKIIKDLKRDVKKLCCLVGTNASQLRYEVPDAAFADTGNPTTAEAKVWGDANLTEEQRKDGALLWYGGTVNDPEYVWMYSVNSSGTIELTEVGTGVTGVSELSDLSDVNTSTPTDRNVLVGDGVDWESRALVEADISDLGSYVSSNLYSADGTLAGVRTVSMNGNDLTFDDAIATGTFRVSTSTIDLNGNIVLDGNVNLEDYGSGTITGTATKFLAVDASGNVIEEDAPSGGATSINELSDGINDGISLFLGTGAGASDDGTSNANVGIGANALDNVVSGFNNVAIGYDAGTTLTGDDNVLVGKDAGRSITGNDKNTGIGSRVLSNGTTASAQTFVGYYAGNNASGQRSTGIGASAQFNASGDYNTSAGYFSLYSASGDYNTTLGYYAGSLITSGSRNIMIGAEIQAASATADYQLNIGDLITGNMTAGSKSVTLAGSFDLTDYGSGTYTGTAAKWLAVDASGNVIEETPPLTETYYGEMYVSASGATTYTSGWEDVPGTWSSGELNGATHSGTELTLTNAGVYKVMASISCSGAANDIWDYGISVNSAAPDTSAIIQRKFGGTDVGAIGLSAIVTVTAGQTIGLQVRRDTGAGEVTFEYANVSVVKL